MIGFICGDFQNQFPWLECDGDQFEQLQCIEENECFCVDPETGIRVSGRSFPRMADVDCGGKFGDYNGMLDYI